MSQVLLLQQDARQVPVRDGSVHLVVTSPPYWNLRDYDESNQIGLEKQHDCLGWATGNRCGNQCYICVMVAVFSECYRVLRNDGVMFVIVGDSYAAKNLCGIPQRLALGLQAAGWTWRSEIIWSKGNAFPESVTDRPTKSHEQILMFTKQVRYFWDQEAVREEAVSGTDLGLLRGRSAGIHDTEHVAWHAQSIATRQSQGIDSRVGNPSGMRNLRDVWHLNSEPTSHQHYATFPTELVSRCIRAGSPETCCGSCGKGWQRVVEHGEYDKPLSRGKQGYSAVGNQRDCGVGGLPSRPRLSSTLQPACTCPPDPVPSLVYDPFLGSGTTVLVARQLRRHGIGGDLSAAYLDIARERLGLKALAAWEGRAQASQEPVLADGLPLFQGL